MNLNDDAWNELRRRYPWPTELPDAPWTEHGWCNWELHEYFDRFLNEDTKLILELGSWLGLSTRYQLKVAPNARIICVDHWRGSSEHQSPSRKDVYHFLPNLYERFIVRMWEWRDRLIAMRTNTQAALPEIAALNLIPDFIYIDADHSTNAVKADILKSRELFPDAQIMGDDWLRESVCRGVKATGLPVDHNRLAWAVKR